MSNPFDRDRDIKIHVDVHHRDGVEANQIVQLYRLADKLHAKVAELKAALARSKKGN